MTEGREPHEEQRAAEEISFLARRATAADRPLFVLVMAIGESARRALSGALRSELRPHDIELEVIDGAALPAVPESGGDLYTQVARASRSGKLALVVDLPRAGIGAGEPDARFLDYLNLHRDRIARERLRLVLVLRSLDVRFFVAQAADLWDFRDGTYWLERPAAVLLDRLWERTSSAARELPLVPADRDSIEAHVRNVRRLVDRTESDRARVGLLADLAAWLERRGATALGAQIAQEARSLLPGDPSELGWRLDLQAGDLHVAEGNGGEARRLYESSLEIARRLAEQEPGRADFQRDLALSFERMARVDEEDRLSWLDRSVKLRRSLLESSPDEAIWQRELGVVLAQRARLQIVARTCVKHGDCSATWRSVTHSKLVSSPFSSGSSGSSLPDPGGGSLQ